MVRYTKKNKKQIPKKNKKHTLKGGFWGKNRNVVFNNRKKWWETKNAYKKRTNGLLNNEVTNPLYNKDFTGFDRNDTLYIDGLQEFYIDASGEHYLNYNGNTNQKEKFNNENTNQTYLFYSSYPINNTFMIDGKIIGLRILNKGKMYPYEKYSNDKSAIFTLMFDTRKTQYNQYDNHFNLLDINHQRNLPRMLPSGVPVYILSQILEKEKEKYEYVLEYEKEKDSYEFFYNPYDSIQYDNTTSQFEANYRFNGNLRIALPLNNSILDGNANASRDNIIKIGKKLRDKSNNKNSLREKFTKH